MGHDRTTHHERVLASTGVNGTPLTTHAESGPEHVVDLAAGNDLLEVTGAVLQAVHFAGIGLALLPRRY